MQENPQDLEITELQVPWLLQVPGTADWPTLTLGFRLAGVLQRCHPTYNSCVTGSNTLRLAVQVIGCVCEGLLPQVSTSEMPSYFNDGNAEGCYLNVNNYEDCYFNDDQGADALKV